MIKADLHIHSNFSDGSDDLKTLISKTAILPIKKGLNIDTGSHWRGDYDSAGEGRYIHNTFIRKYFFF